MINLLSRFSYFLLVILGLMAAGCDVTQPGLNSPVPILSTGEIEVDSGARPPATATMQAERGPGQEATAFEPPVSELTVTTMPEASGTMSELEPTRFTTVTLTLGEETQTPSVNSVVEKCNRAAAGNPIDVSIPDGTRIYQNEAFSKTWRLVNAGTCTWTSEYAVVWFSGQQLAPAASQNLHSMILPGQSVDITVDMIAPEEPGIYQSNWKLQDATGDQFGLGPNGDSPFWTRIEVLPVDGNTPTPDLAVEPTATPEVFHSGTTSLFLDEQLDADSGTINAGEGDDFRFDQNDESQRVLFILEGSRAVLFTGVIPTFGQCKDASKSDSPVLLDGAEGQLYLCYETNQGLPGFAILFPSEPDNRQLTIEYVTWAVP